MEYRDFLESKRLVQKPCGFEPHNLNGHLFDFQRDIVSWACRKGRAAIFADCGMGKTIMQLSWAQQVFKHRGGVVLIVAPLAVAAQTCREGRMFGIEVNRCRTKDDLRNGINITNYEMLQHFEGVDFTGVVLEHPEELHGRNAEPNH